MKHFKFGENWKSFSKLIDKERLNHSISSLKKLTNKKNLNNLSFLDIGCGSGLSSLAAIKLNCSELYAIDRDEQSVETTKIILKNYKKKKIKIEKLSVFDLSERKKFDIVFSWGVLHHTGNMLKAIEKSTRMVSKNGLLIFSLYKKTYLCNFWKIEKFIYKSSPLMFQKFIKFLFISIFSLGLLLTKRSLLEYKHNYKKQRGMNFLHDVHDWLGGYPYESITTEETIKKLKSYNFKLVKCYEARKKIGFLGTGCDEYVFVRNQKKIN